MKRLRYIFCSGVFILSLMGCDADTTADVDYSHSTLTGQVTEISESKLTLQLGSLEEPGTGDSGISGEAPEKPEDESTAVGGEVGAETPEKPEGEPGEVNAEAPEKPEGEPGEANAEAPEKPEGEPGEANAEAPEKPEGEAMDKPGGDMPSGDMGGMTAFTAGEEETVTIDIDKAVIIIEAGMESREGTIDDIEVDDVLVIEVGDDNVVESVTIKNIGSMEPMAAGGDMPGGSFGGSGAVNQGTAANTIDADGEYTDTLYDSDGDDENALRVDGAEVTLSGITVNKNGGATSNTEDGDFYGMNAALLATNGATVTITDAEVFSSAQNGNGVFSYGEGTVVNILDSTITTTADNSGGIQTTGGGTTNASNLIVNTSGSSAAAIRSDRGGGTVNVDGGSYTSNGYNSPAVYSTADITVKNATLTANNSEALVIEGQNSITLENCEVIGNMSDTEGTSSDENVHNVMIYQSMSGDAEVGLSSFSMKGGSLTSKNGDLFYVTNTQCTLFLSNVTIVNEETDGYLLRISGNSASRGWGNAGSNGAKVDFTADAQALEGDIAVDTISQLNMTLTNGSSLTGTINIIENEQNGAAVDDYAIVTIEEGCTWTLTGDCTLTELANNGTINYNGYTITLSDGTVLSEN